MEKKARGRVNGLTHENWVERKLPRNFLITKYGSNLLNSCLFTRIPQ